MRNFHGQYKNSNFFEGWYLKHQCGNHTVCFIPSFHRDQDGKGITHIQVVTNTQAYCVPFSENSFSAHPSRFYVKIQNNLFCEKGIRIALNTPQLQIHGTLRYSPFIPLRYNIMGPFCIVPFMQCNHGVLSLAHRVDGNLIINNQAYSFSNGLGYIEKDWGCSFPKSYLWLQGSWLDKQPCCIMVSIAHIPFLGKYFTGCICCILHQGRQYRLATYLGVQIIKVNRKEIVLQQGKYIVQVNILQENALVLPAPKNGAMGRTISESPSCILHLRFWIDGQLTIDKVVNTAGFEFIDKENAEEIQLL